MTDKKDKLEAQNPEPAETGDAKPKSNLIKHIIYGVCGIVLIGGIAFGIAFFLTGSKSAETAEPEQAEVKKEAVKEEPKKDSHADTESKSEDSAHLAKLEDLQQEGEDFVDDSVDMDFIDRSAIDKIVDNLEFLDYKPNDSELKTANGISVEDSVKEMSWIEKEKTQLAQRKAELDKREKELTDLQRSIDAKIIRIDQVESNRVSQLAKLYDGMDARAVAQLMMALDDETVVSIIPRMKSKQGSMVLQLIPSKRAAKLSKQMITIAGN